MRKESYITHQGFTSWITGSMMMSSKEKKNTLETWGVINVKGSRST